MSASVEHPTAPAPRFRRFVWNPLVWLARLSWAVVRYCLRFVRWCLTPLFAVLRPLHSVSWWDRHTRSWANRLRLRSVPLRRWLVLALAALIFLPIIAGFTAAGIVHFQPDDREIEAEILLDDGAQRWNDPAWQARTTAELAEHGIDFVLYEDGVEIYRSTANPQAGNDFPGGVRQVTIDRAGGQMALIYGDECCEFGGSSDDEWIVPVVALGTLALTFIGMAIFFGRSVVKPLAATSAAAGEIAGGNLKISLPGSRVREVSELNAAFEGMASALSDSLAHEAALQQERRLFVGAVAHDLRTPLFSLRGSLEAIQTGIADTEEKRAHYLATAQEKADALDRLVSDLFDFTRLEFLDQEPKREVLEIGPLAQRTVDAFRPRAEEKQISLTFSDRTAGRTIPGDAHLLTRAIDNLVDNAIRFTPEGGAAQVECLRDDMGVIISVSDNGPGIPLDDLPHIFEPLYRGESSRNRRTGGAGLGLTIARNVFLAHGGDLKARNGSPSGAIFIATLPGASPP
jgi:signal transduction histidine kinase